MKQRINSQLVKRYLRAEAKTQFWLSKKLKVTPKTVTNMLNGTFPRPKTLKRLAKITETSLRKLVIPAQWKSRKKTRH